MGVLIEETTEGQNAYIDTYYALQHRQRKGYLLAKRILDVVISILGLAVCFLPMLIISLMIKLDSPGPAIYLHQRIGRAKGRMGAKLQIRERPKNHSNRSVLAAQQSG